MWIIYRQEYGLIEIMDFRSREEKITFLNSRLNKLTAELSNKKNMELSKEQENLLSIYDFISRLLIVVLFNYSLIFRNSFPILNFTGLEVAVCIIVVLGLLVNTIGLFFRQQKYFIERLQRRTVKHLKNLEKSNFNFSLKSIF